MTKSKTTAVLTFGRKARRKVAAGAKAVLTFAMVVLGYVFCVAVIALFLAAIEGFAALIGVPAFAVYLFLLLMLWVGVAVASVPSEPTLAA